MGRVLLRVERALRPIAQRTRLSRLLARRTGLGRADVRASAGPPRTLPWKDSVDHDDPDGVFRFERADDGDWDLYRNAAVQYRIEQHPRVLSEFDAMCWYHQTSPNSPFTRSTVCSRRTDEGRVTLSGRRLITTTADGKHKEEIAEDDLLLATYTTVFGIELERLPSPPLPNPNPPW